ncbi:hypothetical protein ATANTOWER_027750, partial [Ataeniobius toweri]|nr:hypothetical protein [Ataeniobius toweri]
ENVVSPVFSVLPCGGLYRANPAFSPTTNGDRHQPPLLVTFKLCRMCADIGVQLKSGLQYTMIPA